MPCSFKWGISTNIISQNISREEPRRGMNFNVISSRSIFSWLQYHHVQITLPGGKRYTCYLHRLVKMLEANQYQMENLSNSDWLQLPASYQWISLPSFDGSDLECSHLCWNSKCLLSDHIAIESHKVSNKMFMLIIVQNNAERIRCQMLETCQGHRDGYDLLVPCIFWI